MGLSHEDPAALAAPPPTHQMWPREAPRKAGPYLLTRSITSPLIDSTASGLSHANCPSACRVEPIEGGKTHMNSLIQAIAALGLLFGSTAPALLGSR